MLKTIDIINVVMEITQWLQTWVPLIVGILAIITGISGIVYKLYSKFVNFVKEEIKEVTKEFKPNGGSSLKDQVNRLETNHSSLANKVDEIYDLLTTPTKPVKISKSKNS
jgi:uncharacterized iron-regulated membrane protein